VVGTLDLRQSFTAVARSSEQWYLVTSLYDNKPVTIEFALTHVTADTVVTSDAEHSFVILANSVKWTMILTGWVFKSNNNGLRLTTKFDTESPVLRVFDRFYDTEDVSRHVFFTEQAEIRLTVPSIVRIDQVNQVLPNTELFKYRERSRTMEFYFPFFFSTLRYDPDVTIIDSSQDALIAFPAGSSGFIVGISIGAVSGIILVLIIVIVSIFLYRRRKVLAKQEENWKGINFDEEMAIETPSDSHSTLTPEDKSGLNKQTPSESSNDSHNGNNNGSSNDS
jgi:hypothetical protein